MSKQVSKKDNNRDNRGLIIFVIGMVMLLATVILFIYLRNAKQNPAAQKQNTQLCKEFPDKCECTKMCEKMAKCRMAYLKLVKLDSRDKSNYPSELIDEYIKYYEEAEDGIGSISLDYDCTTGKLCSSNLKEIKKYGKEVEAIKENQERKRLLKSINDTLADAE